MVTRAVLRGAAANGAARAMAVAIGAGQAAFLTRHLTLSEYGVAVSLSILGVSGLVAAAIGARVGNALMTRRHDEDAPAAQLFVSATVLMSLAAALAGAILYGLWPLLPWLRLINASDHALFESARRGVALAVGAQLAAMPLGLAMFGFRAYQETEAIAVQTLATAGLSFVIAAGTATIWPSVAVVSAAPFLANLLASAATYVAFIRRRGWTHTWVPIRATWTHVAPLARGMAEFAALGLVFGCLSTTTTYLVSSTQGFAAAGRISLYLTLLLSVLNVQGEMLHPLWPVYASPGNTGPSVHRTLVQSAVWSALLMVGASIVLALVGRPVLRWLTGLDLPLPGATLLALACYAVSYAVVQAISTYLSATNRIMEQVAVGGAGIVALGIFAVVGGTAFGTTGVVSGVALGVGIVAAGLGLRVWLTPSRR
jgi:O-antigen/teichoic acid export membrane protein